MNKKLGVFIPARLESERLPKKLVLPINGTSLFQMACEKLNNLDDRFEKYVLINDDELIDIAKQYENINIIVRDKHTCEVDSPLTYIFKDIEDINCTHLMFLNPCLSFLSKETIERSLEEFLEKDYEYATSVKGFKNWLFDSYNTPLTPINYKNLNTKEISGLYQCAHAFHIFNKEKFFKNGKMLDDGLGIIEVPEEELYDVDTLEDYLFVKWRWENSEVCG